MARLDGDVHNLHFGFLRGLGFLPLRAGMAAIHVGAAPRSHQKLGGKQKWKGEWYLGTDSAVLLYPRKQYLCIKKSKEIKHNHLTVSNTADKIGRAHV